MILDPMFHVLFIQCDSSAGNCISRMPSWVLTQIPFAIEPLPPKYIYQQYQQDWEDKNIHYPYSGENRQLKKHPALEIVFNSIMPIGPYMVPPGSPLLQNAMSDEPQSNGWHLTHFPPVFVERLFMLPGVTVHREFLIANFPPPITAFRKSPLGTFPYWGSFFIMGDDESNKKFEKLFNEIASLLMLGRAAFALAAEDQDMLEVNVCPHYDCDWWDWRICSGVIDYPKDHQTCEAKTIIHSSLSGSKAKELSRHPD